LVVVGWQKNTGPPPTAESFHLACLRRAFVNDRLSLEEFEEGVEHVLRGGGAGKWVAPRGLPYPEAVRPLPDRTKKVRY
jgi:hypothetical protein